MRLYLIRHDQTVWNAAGLAQGHTDMELDETGLAQAEMLGKAFEGVEIETVYTSDLSRAKKTAEAVAKATNAQLVIDPIIRERCFGEWEGRTFVHIAEEYARIESETGRERHTIAPPKGESYEDTWHRIASFAKQLENVEAPTAVVGHGGACSLLLARLLQGNMATARAFRLHNTSITELHRHPEGFWVMRRYDDTSHLETGQALSGSVDGTAR